MLRGRRRSRDAGASGKARGKSFCFFHVRKVSKTRRILFLFIFVLKLQRRIVYDIFE
jgi:hypothetical protein